MLNKKIKKIHCIGIGGIGVSGIAALLHKKGYQVTGSDLKASSLTAQLEKSGIKIFYHHSPENIDDADLIVYSSAVSKRNPEMTAAKQKKIPTVRRAEMLVELMKEFKGIAVAGTHGKTTTTSLITWILMTAGLDPSYMIGGIVRGLENHVSFGEGEYFVAEADESDASFLYFMPQIAVVNNIEPDHLNTYQGDFEKLKRTFLTFLKSVKPDGLCVLGIDSPAVAACIPALLSPTVTYGLHEMADYRAVDIHYQGLQTAIKIKRPEQKALDIVLNLPGEHNVQNALAAVAVTSELKISDKKIQEALLSFQGVGRRFHLHGDIKLNKGKALLLDDYGHHPTAIDYVLKTAKQVYPNRRIVLVFQPHRYSRTQDLFQEFVKVLAKADVLVLTEVYAASEKKINGADGNALYTQIAKLRQNKSVYFVSHLDKIPAVLNDLVQENDVVILQGAGDIVKLVEVLI